MHAPDLFLRLRLTLVGPMDAWSISSERVLPKGKKTRALLAFLALSPNDYVSRAELAAFFWPRSAEEQARGSLRQALYELSSALMPVGPDLLVFQRDEVGLNKASIWVDALEIMRATMECPEALDLFTAPLLPELDGISVASDAWLASERRKLTLFSAKLAHDLSSRLSVEQREETANRLLHLDPEPSNGELGYGPFMPAPRLPRIPTYEASEKTNNTNLTVCDTSWTEPEKSQIARRGVRLGVPPLAVLSTPDESHLAKGLAEEITAGLSRFRWLFLADPAMLGSVSDPMRIATAMDLDALLLGSVQRVERHVRVTLRLVDPQSAGEAYRSVLWAAHFDSHESDQIALQDEIATAVVSRLDPELLFIEAKRARARTPRDASAHDLVLRAIPALHAMQRNTFEEAGQLLEEAIQRDAHYAAAHTWAACWELFRVGQGWATDYNLALGRAGKLAARAAQLDPFDALALTVQGHVLAYLHHRPEEACALHERALALNPNLAMAWVFSGLAHCYCGRHEEALSRFARYGRLAPLHPMAFFFDAARLVPLMLLGRHEETIEAARAVSVLNAEFSFPLRPWLASLGWLSRHKEADVIRARLLFIEPQLTIRSALKRAPLRSRDRQVYAEGLRRAGLPES